MVNLEFLLTATLHAEDGSCTGCQFIDGSHCAIFDQQIMSYASISREGVIKITVRCAKCYAAEKLLQERLAQKQNADQNLRYEPRCKPPALPKE